MNIRLILFFLLTCCSCWSQDIDDLYRKYTDYIQTAGPDGGIANGFVVPTWVTPEIRAMLIQKAQRSSNDPDQWISSAAQSTLVLLGDDAADKAYIAHYHETPNTGPMPALALLPYFADDLYHGSTKDGVYQMSIMDTSTLAMCETINHSRLFPPKTRSWAANQWGNSHGPTSQGNLLMREWWEHNKDAVLSHQYDKATWLPPESEGVPTQRATSPVASSQPTSTKNSSSPLLTQPSDDLLIPFWIYGAIIVCLSSIGAAWYFLRSKR